MDYRKLEMRSKTDAESLAALMQDLEATKVSGIYLHMSAYLSPSAFRIVYTYELMFCRPNWLQHDRVCPLW